MMSDLFIEIQQELYNRWISLISNELLEQFSDVTNLCPEDLLMLAFNRNIDACQLQAGIYVTSKDKPCLVFTSEVDLGIFIGSVLNIDESLISYTIAPDNDEEKTNILTITYKAYNSDLEFPLMWTVIAIEVQNDIDRSASNMKSLIISSKQ